MTKELSRTQIANVNLVSKMLKTLLFGEVITLEQFKTILTNAYQLDYLLSESGARAWIMSNTTQQEYLG